MLMCNVHKVIYSNAYSETINFTLQETNIFVNKLINSVCEVFEVKQVTVVGYASSEGYSEPSKR